VNTVTNDFDGEVRPRGGGTEIGADEFSTTQRPIINGLLREGADWVIRFASLQGESYDVQWAGDLASANWPMVASRLPGDGTELAVADPSAVGQRRRFYRVRLSP
jgi:hypothetical protein